MPSPREEVGDRPRRCRTGCGGATGEHVRGPTTQTRPEGSREIWKNLGEWSGRGNAQTESLVGLKGSLRMHWRTKNEVPKEAGTFRMILRSAISGRALQEPVDEKGLGEGTAYTADDPRVFYITVESANLGLVVHSGRGAVRQTGRGPKEPPH